jgi:hypothetical protein
MTVNVILWIHTFALLFLAVLGCAILARLRRLEHALWNERLIREGHGINNPFANVPQRGGAAYDTGVDTPPTMKHRDIRS